ncbi:hypothetical protein [Campylobacter concisus]|uniref:Uncharacterized protein n=1 Tax=Campylobacter concisus TaxID=199 RepID=A0A7S9WRA5_9BACT|nr:hypothetical protein [Campylobacter concisus]QPH90382.1 hypothetical protein CVT00_02245 [Campylobacter concisus]
MKFKTILLLSFLISLNLSAFEPMNPSIATKKASDDYKQVDTLVWCDADYGSDFIDPSFKCYDDSGKYKFKKYSLEDLICQSDYNSFRDNYFADLYNLIVKEKPNLKVQAEKINRDRIKNSKKKCIARSYKKFEVNCNDTDVMSNTIHCIKSHYRSYTAKLALLLYKNDKELFKRIYGEDYEKFKEVFEDTLKYVPILYSEVELNGIKNTDDKPYAEFLRKYDDYTGNYGNYKIHDLIYIVLVQYSLIDKNGHLVLPENRKEE